MFDCINKHAKSVKSIFLIICVPKYNFAAWIRYDFSENSAFRTITHHSLPAIALATAGSGHFKYELE
jgi:hypothetical protein